MRVAGLDLGTNTFLCLIADVDQTKGIQKVLRDEVRIVRLGQAVHATRELHPEALERAEAALKEFSAFIREAKCEKVLAVATSAARDSKNGHRLLELGERYGIPVQIISGEKEAELTFAGAVQSDWQGRVGVIDVGGGSTEMIVGTSQGVEGRFSANVGSVRLTEMMVKTQPIDRDTVGRLRTFVREELKRVAVPDLRIEDVDMVVAVAGTPTTLAAVDLGHAFESEQVHGHRFTLATLENWTDKLATMTVAERVKLAGMEPKRADVIVAGAICVTEALRLFNRSELRVSVRGLRYGVAEWCARL